MSTGEAPRARVRRPGKHIVLFAAAALAVMGAGVLGFRQSSPESAVREAASATVPLGEFLVDLSPDRTGRIAYLKLSASVALPAARAKPAAARLEAERAIVRERIAFLLRGLTPEDLAGAEGMQRLKTEMLRRINLAIAPERAEDVVILDMIVQ